MSGWRYLGGHDEGWGEDPTPSGKEDSPLAPRRNSLYVEDRGRVAYSCGLLGNWTSAKMSSRKLTS